MGNEETLYLGSGDALEIINEKTLHVSPIDKSHFLFIEMPKL